jgi:uncharacterized protein (DUF2141 family)
MKKSPLRAIWNLVVLACGLVSWPASAGPFAVIVSQARHDSGQVRCGLFDYSEGWRKEELAMRAIDRKVRWRRVGNQARK